VSPKNKKQKISLVPVAHACKGSSSGGKDWEDCGSKPDLGKKFSKIPNTKSAGGVAEAVVRKISGLSEFSIVFQSEQSSLSLSILFNCKCV
jgi:hypothetical protein